MSVIVFIGGAWQNWIETQTISSCIEVRAEIHPSLFQVAGEGVSDIIITCGIGKDL